MTGPVPHCPACDFVVPEHSRTCPDYRGPALAPGEPSRECFQAAGLFMVHYGAFGDTELTLCHGEVLCNASVDATCGTYIDHGWVEIAEGSEIEDDTGDKAVLPVPMVVDKTQPDRRAWYLPAPVFYARTSARNVKRYTYTQMVEHATRHGNDGPWPD